MDIFFGVIAILGILLIFSVDLVIIPLGLKIILSWFGVSLGFWQCLIIVLFFNIITCGFRKKG